MISPLISTIVAAVASTVHNNDSVLPMNGALQFFYKLDIA